MNNTSPEDHTSSSADARDAAWKAVAQALKDLKFGQVTIIVQDSRIVQIDRTDKIRLGSGGATG